MPATLVAHPQLYHFNLLYKQFMAENQQIATFNPKLF